MAESFEVGEAVQIATSAVKDHDGPIKPSPASCRVAKEIMISPRRKAPVIVHLAFTGAFMVQGMLIKSTESLLKVVMEIADTMWIQ